MAKMILNLPLSNQEVRYNFHEGTETDFSFTLSKYPDASSINTFSE